MSQSTSSSFITEYSGLSWVWGLENLTKKQLKCVLNENGRSTAGSKTLLLERLKKALPQAKGFLWSSNQAEDEARCRYKFCDAKGKCLDTNSCGLKQAVRIIEERLPAVKSLQERFPDCKVFTNDTGYISAERPRLILYPRITTSNANTTLQDGRTQILESNSRNRNICSRVIEGLGNVAFEDQIIVIVGKSGVGKSVLLQEWKQNEVEIKWEEEKAVISQFGESQQGKKWLSAVGLTSVPSWCKPYHILSTGERYRANMARKLQHANQEQQVLVVDNFTNNLDHKTAVCVSACISKQIRRLRMGCVIATNNEDIIAYLQPNMIIRLSSGDVPNIVSIMRIKSPIKTGPKVRIRVSKDRVCSQIGLPADKARHSPYVVKSGLTNSTIESKLKDRFRFDHGEEESSQVQQRRGRTVLRTTVGCDEATNMCNALFDKQFNGECCIALQRFPCKKDLGSFLIGVIVGESGSSKSLLLRHHFGEPALVMWNNDCTVLSHFSSVQTGEMLLQVVGLAMDIGCKVPYNLSEGEMERVNLMRLLDAEDETKHGKVSHIYVDEFTSSLDRSTARDLVINMYKYIRENYTSRRREFVFVTCHFDVLSFATPDWVFDTSFGFYDCRKLERLHCDRYLNERFDFDQYSYMKYSEIETIPVPNIQLELEMCEPWVWMLFRDHHYKTRSLSKRAHTFVLRWNNVLVGFIAAIPHVGRKHQLDLNLDSSKMEPAMKKRKGDQMVAWRAHRTVILPSWQGLGIGSRLSDAVAEVFRLNGYSYYGQTVHPRFGEYRDRSSFWEDSKWNHTTTEYKIESWKQRLENVRIKLLVPKYIYSHIYVGPQGEQQEKEFESDRVTFY